MKQFTDKIIFHTKNISPIDTSLDITQILQENIQTEIIQNIEAEVSLDNKTQSIKNITQENTRNITNLLNIDDIEDDL